MDRRGYSPDYSPEELEDIISIFNNNFYNYGEILGQLLERGYIVEYELENEPCLVIPNNKMRLNDWVMMVLRLRIEKKNKFYKEIYKENKMMLRIKQTDRMSITEFRENKVAYERVTIVLDKSKTDTYEEDYGKLPFIRNHNYEININEDVIEFKPKALLITDEMLCKEYVPYELINSVIGEYYLESKTKEE